MKIFPLKHSGFLVELNDHYLLFDFWQAELPLLEATKPMYVFVSHAHHDHYDPTIKKLNAYYDRCTYLAAEVVDPFYREAKANRRYRLDDVIVSTLGSTDEGVAFLVEVEGKKIFHAGDLHLWYWEDDTSAERADMYQRYLDEIQKLSAEHIDLAFCVLDNRQDEQVALLGIELLADMVKVDKIMPMHDGFGRSLISQRIKKSKIADKLLDTRSQKVHEI
ncbi:MAG: MBL fold metallo-hydrolase [Erysipelotrichaceae bacterium]|nr:MBL fold metallo-hydrolase [Erysipelotrichaceae bacterium]MDY5252605.1 MBL fold metallo-hydrolase [Erysipelotrichaceae bacterium]